MLTATRLRELLNYDPATGAFTWRVDRQRYLAGQQAGTARYDGRRSIKVDQIDYCSGRLAWLYMTGKWPRKHVDHKNCNALDDRWENLREATSSQNVANQRSKGKGRLKGVTWQKDRRKFMAHIRVNYRKINLGRYDTAEAAQAAYIAAANKYFGEFARSS
jgi:hypothetical protein